MAKRQKKKPTCILIVAILLGLCILPYAIAEGEKARKETTAIAVTQNHPGNPFSNLFIANWRVGESLAATILAYTLWIDMGAPLTLYAPQIDTAEVAKSDGIMYPIGSSASVSHMPH